MDGAVSIQRWRQILSGVLAGYTLGLAALMMVTGDPGGESGVEWLYLLPVLTAAIMGLFLALRRPENAIGTLISVTGAALMTLGTSNYLVPRAFEAGDDLTVVLVLLVADAAWIAQFFCTLVLLPLWFPTGSPMNRTWGWVGRVAVGAAVIGWVSFVFSDHVCVVYESPESSICAETVPIPWGVDGFAGFELLPLIGMAMVLIGMAMAIPAIASVFVRWHRSKGVERQQLKWVLLASTAVALGIILSFDIFGMPQRVNDTVGTLSLAGLWVAIAVAILKYRLYDIDRIISRTVSYALVLVVLGLVVLGLVALFAVFLPSDDPLVVAISTLAAAVLFDPVRRRVQALIDRRFNRSRYNAQRVIGRFTESLQEQVDPAEVVDGWVEVVEGTMQPERVGVWVRE
ncbi:MAG: hypothetical protein WD274_03405 [Acidimicrobiia bacterium]